MSHEKQLLEKHLDLVLCNIVFKKECTVILDNLEFSKMRNARGYCVLVAPSELYAGDATNIELDKYLINDNLIEMIQSTKQPSGLRVDKVYKEETEDDDETDDDEDRMLEPV